MGEGEQQALLTLCNPDAAIASRLPDCQALQSRLEQGETLVVRDGWFNFSLARGESRWTVTQWRSQTADSAIVNRITPQSDDQWAIEVWLLQEDTVRPITDVFPYLSDEFWDILNLSIFSDALYSDAVIAASARLPIDWNDLTPDHSIQLAESPTSQTLLELFGGNQLVFTGQLESRTVFTRSCSGAIEEVFGQELPLD